MQAYEDQHGPCPMTRPVSAQQAMPIQRTWGPTRVPVLPSTAPVRRPEVGEKEKPLCEATRPVWAQHDPCRPARQLFYFGPFLLNLDLEGTLDIPAC